MRILLLFILLPGLTIAGPKEDLLIIVNDLQNMASANSKNKLPAQPTQQNPLRQSPELIIGKLAIHAFNFTSAQGMYKQFKRENHKNWFFYGVGGVKDVQLKFVYTF